jgi:putative sporulation protein YtaF
MHWVSILFIAFASNLDNLGIGISVGMRLTKIPVTSNVIIALITMMGTYVAMTLGQFISRYLPMSMANMLGAAIITAIGLWTVAGTLRRNVKSNLDDGLPGLSRSASKMISTKESFTLGLALALNNMATGFGAGATGVSPVWTTIVAGIFSLLLIGVGSKIGLLIVRTWFGRYSVAVSGILLILIGIYEMIA